MDNSVDNLSSNPVLVNIFEFLDHKDIRACKHVNKTIHNTIERNWKRFPRTSFAISIQSRSANIRGGLSNFSADCIRIVVRNVNWLGTDCKIDICSNCVYVSGNYQADIACGLRRIVDSNSDGEFCNISIEHGDLLKTLTLTLGWILRSVEVVRIIMKEEKNKSYAASFSNDHLECIRDCALLARGAKMKFNHNYIDVRELKSFQWEIIRAFEVYSASATIEAEEFSDQRILKIPNVPDSLSVYTELSKVTSLDGLRLFLQEIKSGLRSGQYVTFNGLRNYEINISSTEIMNLMTSLFPKDKCKLRNNVNGTFTCVVTTGNTTFSFHN